MNAVKSSAFDTGVKDPIKKMIPGIIEESIYPYLNNIKKLSKPRFGDDIVWSPDVFAIIFVLDYKLKARGGNFKDFLVSKDYQSTMAALDNDFLKEKNIYEFKSTLIRYLFLLNSVYNYL